jgi:hypothetical protein
MIRIEKAKIKFLLRISVSFQISGNYWQETNTAQSGGAKHILT